MIQRIKRKPTNIPNANSRVSIVAEKWWSDGEVLTSSGTLESLVAVPLVDGEGEVIVIEEVAEAEFCALVLFEL